jgi:hypothetical protein
MTLQPTMSLTISSPSHSQQEKSFSHTPGDETLVETHSHSAFFEKQEEVFPPIDVMMEEKSYPTQSSPLSSVPPGSRTASQVQVMEPMETDTKPPPPLEPLPILPLHTTLLTTSRRPRRAGSSDYSSYRPTNERKP